MLPAQQIQSNRGDKHSEALEHVLKGIQGFINRRSAAQAEAGADQQARRLPRTHEEPPKDPGQPKALQQEEAAEPPATSEQHAGQWQAFRHDEAFHDDGQPVDEGKHPAWGQCGAEGADSGRVGADERGAGYVDAGGEDQEEPQE